MKEHEDNRSPEEIARDVERTRAEMSHTLEAIQNKLTPGQMMDQAFAYARTSLPADFGSNLNRTVRENPLPVALVGIGLAWLMMSNQRGTTDARYSRNWFDRDSGVDYDGAYGSDGSSEGSMHRAAARLNETGRSMRDRAGQTGEQVKEGMQHMKESASEMGQRASAMASDVGERGRHAMHDAEHRMRELGQRSQEQYYRARDGISHLMEEQPLVLGAIGLAIGAALGSAFPVSRREDELMGSTRDDMLDRAREMGEEQAQQLKQSAQRVTETVREEARNVGEQSKADVQGSAAQNKESPTATGVQGTGTAPRSLH